MDFVVLGEKVKEYFVKYVNIKNLQRLFVFIFCLLIFFHGPHYTLRQRKKKQTVGTNKKIEVVLNFNNLIDGKFQNDLEAYLKNKGVMAKDFKKLLNLYTFKIFSSTNSGVIIGNGGELFQNSYLFEKLAIEEGDTVHKNSARVDDSIIEEHAKKTKMVYDVLKKNGIQFVYIFAPTKADFREEKIPDKYACFLTKETENKRNYIRLRKAIEKSGMPFFDANEYFLKNKDKKDYPLFTRYGVHWSNFGFYSFIKDEIFKKIFKNDLICDIYTQNEPIGSDADMGNIMEIRTKKLRYVDLGYIKNCKLSKDNSKKILLVGDSFTDIFTSNKDFQKMFKDETDHFGWWYYKRYFPFSDNSPKEELSVDEKIDIIRKKDIIFFIATTPNLFNEDLNKFFSDVLNNFK